MKLVAVLIGFVIGWLAISDVVNRLRPIEVVRAIGVISPCGIYAVATVKSDGSVTLHDATRPATPDEEAEVNALPREARIPVMVPCPTLVNPGTQAQQ